MHLSLLFFYLCKKQNAYSKIRFPTNRQETCFIS